MCLYIYVDVLGLLQARRRRGHPPGKVFTFDITQTFMVSALAARRSWDDDGSCSRRSFPARQPCDEPVVATLLIPWMGFNLVGGEWLAYHGLGSPSRWSPSRSSSARPGTGPAHRRSLA